MIIHREPSPRQSRERVHVEHRQRPVPPVALLPRHRQVELLVKVAIVHLPVPAHAHQVPAHHPVRRRRVEVFDEQLHVLLRLARPVQFIRETLDGHVGQSDETREIDPVSIAELGPVRRLQVRLRRG